MILLPSRLISRWVKPPQEKTREKVLWELQRLEEREDVRVLYAAEYGAHAWGTAGPDTPWKCHFYFVRTPRHYLTAERYQIGSSMVVLRGAPLDLHGYDLRWGHWDFKNIQDLHSPIVYVERGPVSERLRAAYSPGLLARRLALHRCLEEARKEYQQNLVGDEVRHIGYLYACRALFTGRCLIEGVYPVPVETSTLIEQQCPEGLQADLQRLLEAKRRGHRFTAEPRNQTLQTLVEKEIAVLDERHRSVWPRDDGELKQRREEHSKIFLDALKQAWGAAAYDY